MLPRWNEMLKQDGDNKASSRSSFTVGGKHLTCKSWSDTDD